MFVAPSTPPAVAAGFVVLAALVQSSLAPYLAIHGAVPSFVTIAVTFYALRARSAHALLLGAFAGLLEDALGGATGGAWTIATALTALLASFAGRAFFADAVTVALGVVFASSLVRSGAFWIVMAMRGYPGGLGTYHVHLALWNALYTTLAAALVLIVRARFEGGRKPMRVIR